MALQRLYISDDEYFALQACSNSALKEAYKIFGTGAVPSYNQNSFRLGSAVDALLTAPEGFSTADLSDDDAAHIMPMRTQLWKNTIYQALFRNAETQAVFVETDFALTIDGQTITVPAKCKFDVWNPKLGFGGDIKTTDAKNQAQFEAAASFFGYDLQAAWYMDVTKSNRFVIMGVSKHHPHPVFIISIKRDSEQYLAGKEKYEAYARPWWMLYGINITRP